VSKQAVALYAQGVSPRHIADRMTQQSVPTAWRLHHHGQASGKWWPRVVEHDLIHSPLNEGILTNFRHTYKLEHADEKHPDDWVQAVPVPPEKQIIVKPDWLDSLDRVIDEPTGALLRARRAGIVPTAPATIGLYIGRALLAGRAYCTCGGKLRVRAHKRRRKVYLYYYCNRHELVPSACPGLSLPVERVGWYAWTELLAVLGKEEYHPGGHLQVLGVLQAKHDTSDDPAVSLAALREVRAQFLADVETYSQEIGRAKTQLARDALQRQIDRIEPEIADADRKIAAAQRQAANAEARRAVLADAGAQWQRYARFVYDLYPDTEPAHVPLCQRVFGLLGARFTLGKDADGDPTVAVELTITAAAAQPWFTDEELEATLDASRAERRAYQAASDPRTPDEVQRAFYLGLSRLGATPDAELARLGLRRGLDDRAVEVLGYTEPAPDGADAEHRPLASLPPSARAI
jgi:hypothetical protein